jgi:hypothetical protein
MVLSRRMSLALGACSLLFLVLVSVAFAGEPASVTVRVEGFNGTLVPQTTVTTTIAPVPVEGGTCSGTSAGGALYDATQGDWEAKFENGEPEPQILGVDGVDLPPFGAGNYAYWALWVNDKFASNGYCGEQLGANADVVVVAQCFALGQYCPASATAPDHFLTATPPTSRVVGVGEPVSVTVGSLSTATEVAEPLPAGVTVTAGPDTAIPNEHGVATLSFSAAGTYTLQARAADSVPSDPYTICVHNGNDGTCGTQAPGSSTKVPSTGAASSGATYTGPYAVVAKAIGLTEGHVYARDHAPRLLQGTVILHGALQDVKLRLTRKDGRKCSYYDGVTERFRAMRCGAAHGVYFSAGEAANFSYLLPAALAPGRYVLDIEATNTAGEHTTLARGTSRIVFYVR